MTFSELYQKHYGLLYFWMLGQTHNKDVAEDVCAVAFMKAFENYGQLEDKDKFKAWLFKIASHVFYKHYRHEKRRTPINEFEEQSGELADPRDFAAEFEKWQEIERGQAALKVLKKHHRKVLEEFLNGSSTSQIARRHRIPEGTVLSRICVAKRQLQELCAA